MKEIANKTLKGCLGRCNQPGVEYQELISIKYTITADSSTFDKTNQSFRFFNSRNFADNPDIFC